MQNQNINGVKFQGPDFGASQNAPQAPEPPKTKTKAKSGVRLGIVIAVVLLVAVGIGTVIFYFSVVPEKQPLYIGLGGEKLQELFDYTVKETDLHDVYVKFGQDSYWDINYQGEQLLTFPKGLYLDTKKYAEYVNQYKAEDFGKSSISPVPANFGTNPSLCTKEIVSGLSKAKLTSTALSFKKQTVDNSLQLNSASYNILLGGQEDKTVLDLQSEKSQQNFPEDYELKVFTEDFSIDLSSIASWQSSDPSVVLVYPNGKLFPVSIGKAVVVPSVCGMALGGVTVDVSQIGQANFDLFNPKGKLDTKFLTGLAKSKKSLIYSLEAPKGKYVREVTLTPTLASIYGKNGEETKNIVNKALGEGQPQYSLYSKNSPIQGVVRFFLSNDGGKTWVEGDKKIDNSITDLSDDMPEIKFNFNNIPEEKDASDLRMAVLFQSDFNQAFFTDTQLKPEAPATITTSYIGSNVINLDNPLPAPEYLFHFQSIKQNNKPVLVLPPPSPVLTGLSAAINFADLPVSPSPSPEFPSEPMPTVKGDIEIFPIVWHRGHSRVILKWKFTSGADNNADPANIDFKYGEKEDGLLLGAKVYRDKNDEQYPYYVVLRGLKGGEYFDKNDAGYKAGRFKNFYQIKTGEKSSGVGKFQTMNRIQTIGYYYDLVLNRQYVSGVNGDLTAWLNPENEFIGKKIKDLENGGPGFFYKPENGEPLTLLGVKFTMLNDKKYQEFDKNIGAAAEQNMTTVVRDLYRKIHDRIYDEDLGKFFDDGGVEYWVSRTDAKIVGKDVMDILGAKFYMSVSTEYQNELYSGIGVADAKPELAYQIVLKRGADSAGLTNLKNKYQFSKDMRKELAMSKEYEDRLSEIEKTRGRAAAIEELYETLYARATDVKGKEHWDKTSLSVLKLRDKFLASEEFVKVLKD